MAAARKHVPVAFLHYNKPNKGNVGLLEPGWIVSYGVNLLASTKTPADVVYKVVKAIHDNASDIGKVFPPLRMLDPKAASFASADGSDPQPRVRRPVENHSIL